MLKIKVWCFLNQCFLYAGHYCTSKNIGELNTITNRDLERLKKWLQGNKLSLDVVVKTQAMVIGSQPNFSDMLLIVSLRQKIDFFLFHAMCSCQNLE